MTEFEQVTNSGTDTGDLVGADARDPAPVEVTDPDNLSYVEPDPSARPVDQAVPDPEGTP